MKEEIWGNRLLKRVIKKFIKNPEFVNEKK